MRCVRVSGEMLSDDQKQLSYIWDRGGAGGPPCSQHVRPIFDLTAVDVTAMGVRLDPGGHRIERERERGVGLSVALMDGEINPNEMETISFRAGPPSPVAG